MPEILKPSFEVLTRDDVLMQAWKKTESYIRYHNWYADTLELDRAAIDLPRFLAKVRARLESPSDYMPGPLRLVPAPKSQRWRINDDSQWKPARGVNPKDCLRPLAHVSLSDQVASTAILLCLADLVENRQGNTRLDIENDDNRQLVCSYGNRLFCSLDTAGRLCHRWGSKRLYNSYFQDYRKFLERPEAVAITEKSRATRTVIVQSDLSKFFDTVRPELLIRKLEFLLPDPHDAAFLTLAARLHNWTWSDQDLKKATAYAANSGVGEFSNVALPQGLVSAGFFANVVLLDFDRALCDTVGNEVVGGLVLHDACRYVDDLRFVFTHESDLQAEELEASIAEWLQSTLDALAPGLQISREKTKAASFGENQRPLLRQSRRMQTVQHAISGGFDQVAAEDILAGIHGLMRSQQEFHQERGSGWKYTPMSDVRDDTVSRFAAGRFRTTYRSLRPLLEPGGSIDESGVLEPYETNRTTMTMTRSRQDLDAEARAFALGLIDAWIADPSNVRLLRVGLDIWPDSEVLESVLALVRPYLETPGRSAAAHDIVYYCMSEILRAGAVETGFVEDEERLPDSIDLGRYRGLLRREAASIAKREWLPWYLRQQSLLYLAVMREGSMPVVASPRSPEIREYYAVLRYLNGDPILRNASETAIWAIFARRAVCDREEAVRLTLPVLGIRTLIQIASRDIGFAGELLGEVPEKGRSLPKRTRKELCFSYSGAGSDTLAQVIRRPDGLTALRNEIGLLAFSSLFLNAILEERDGVVLTPCDVSVLLSDEAVGGVASVSISASKGTDRSMYSPPGWCRPDSRWRFNLGFLLRFILTCREDFTKPVSSLPWREKRRMYRSPGSHWHMRVHGLFSGHSAFGDDWLPISEWFEGLLFRLLAWPGCQVDQRFDFVDRGIKATVDAIEEALAELASKERKRKGAMLLSLRGPEIVESGRDGLRVCIVQTIIPGPGEFVKEEITLSSPKVRRAHRNHLATALAAVRRMLDLRSTHNGGDRRVDLLVLPELAVHPADLTSHVIPFVRAEKASVFTGLTYEKIFGDERVVNSAMWVFPSRSPDGGVQIRMRRQGKEHLAPMEIKLSNQKKVDIIGFRPAQWVVEYGRRDNAFPLRLTGAICYDATDLDLASDLRGESDVFIIPALNQDVGTFDQMAQSLHYHMFQLVMIVNNGLYGGSNAYGPYKEMFHRQVFHLHGQPQASIAFLEIGNLAEFVDRHSRAREKLKVDGKKVKFPPAGVP